MSYEVVIRKDGNLLDVQVVESHRDALRIEKYNRDLGYQVKITPLREAQISFDEDSTLEEELESLEDIWAQYKQVAQKQAEKKAQDYLTTSRGVKDAKTKDSDKDAEPTNWMDLDGYSQEYYKS